MSIVTVYPEVKADHARIDWYFGQCKLNFPARLLGWTDSKTMCMVNFSADDPCWILPRLHMKEMADALWKMETVGGMQ